MREVFAASRSHLIRRLAGIQKFTGRNAYAVSAEGVEVHLSDGRRVLDLGTWPTTLLGHRHPAVVAAVVEQSESLPTAPRGFANASAPLLAQRLVEFAQPSRLERVWFGANGSDVVEATLKLSRLATGRLRVLAVRGGFHGRTLGALSVSDADRYHQTLEPLLGHVSFVEATEDAVEREAGAGDVAALIFEIVQGSGRVVPLDPAMLRRWTDAAHAAGALVIVDEIQTGLWRCGPFSLALSLGLDPDAVLLGKTLGGGVVPLAAALCAPELHRPLEASPFLHSQTFSGHPLACAAGLATLDIAPDAAAESSERIGRWLESLASRLRGMSDLLVAVDVCGLMLSLDFVSAEVAQQFLVAAAYEGVLLCALDGDPAVLRLLAPLVLRDAEMAEAADIVVRLCGDPGSWPTRFESLPAQGSGAA